MWKRVTAVPSGVPSWVTRVCRVSAVARVPRRRMSEQVMCSMTSRSGPGGSAAPGSRAKS
ncbi:hypothetical protein SFUMM280S_00195 [Streptomyces fumanus]